MVLQSISQAQSQFRTRGRTRIQSSSVFTAVPPTNIAQHIALTLMILLASVPPAPLLCAHAACKLADFHFHFKAQFSVAVVAACGGDYTTPVPDGTTCNLPDSLCDSDETFIHEYHCFQNHWVWSHTPTFCSKWKGCALSADGRNLTCIAVPGDIESHAARHVPANIDQRIHHIYIRGYPRLNFMFGDFSRDVPELKSLTISECVMYNVDSDALAPLTQLRHLNLSHNVLTMIASNLLPPIGMLQTLDLRGNPLREPGVDPFALHAALATCDPSEPPRQLYMDSDACVMVQRDGCQRVLCDPSMQPALTHTCPDGERLNISRVQICDDVTDCVGGGDERNCRGTFESMVSDQEQDLCALLGFGLLPNYEIHSGLMLLRLNRESETVSMVVAFDAVMVAKIGNDTTEFYGSNGTFSHAEIDGNILTLTVRPLSFDSFICRAHIYPEGGGSSPGTTTVRPATAGGGSAGDSESVGPAVGAAVAAVLVVVAAAVGMFYYWSVGGLRRRQQIASELQGCINEANDKFFTLYASLWDTQTMAAGCETLHIDVRQLTLSSTVLGSGNFGTVVLGTLRQRKDASTHPAAVLDVAVKSIRGGDTAAVVQFLFEARLLHALQPQPHIVQLLGVQQRVLPVMLVMEYCELGNLRDYLRRTVGDGAPLAQELLHFDMARQVATAVEYLHSRLCVHRDLAARNVLLTRRQSGAVSDDGRKQPLSRCGLVLKLADVGSARMLRTNVDYYKSTSDDAVPIRWQCPLAVRSKVYTSKADVYSFGVLVYEIFSNGGTPYAQLAVSEVGAMVEAGHRLERPSATTAQGIVELIRECTQMTMVGRPAMSGVRQWLERAVLDARERQAFVAGGDKDGVGVAQQQHHHIHQYGHHEQQQQHKYQPQGLYGHQSYQQQPWLSWDEPEEVAAMQQEESVL